jgi:hemoglobin-like flavoprotein
MMVQESWQQVMSEPETAIVLFYSKLFCLDPKLECLFSDDLDQSGIRLLETMTLVVDKLDQFETLVAELQALGDRHMEYGVQSEHYQIAGQALLWMLELMLDEPFTPEVEQAWSKTYKMMASTMQESSLQVIKAA